MIVVYASSSPLLVHIDQAASRKVTEAFGFPLETACQDQCAGDADTTTETQSLFSLMDETLRTSKNPRDSAAAVLATVGKVDYDVPTGVSGKAATNQGGNQEFDDGNRPTTEEITPLTVEDLARMQDDTNPDSCLLYTSPSPRDA